jgi:hypothetical protein
VAAHVASHQRVQPQAALGQLLLGQHHDQVFRAFWVPHFVAAGGVVNGPAAGPDPDLAAVLFNGSAALPGRHDLEVARVAGARHLRSAQHAVAVGLQPRHHDVAGARGLHMAVEGCVAVQVGLEPEKQPGHPVAPERGALAGGRLVGGQGRGFGHGEASWE